MSTDSVAVERHQGAAPPALPVGAELSNMLWIAEQICTTEFVPKGVRGKKEATLACMMTGRELGIGIMRALRQIDVIDGKPSPNAELMMSRVLEAGHYIRVAKYTREEVVVRARRREWPEDEPTFECSWTDADVRQARLQGKDNHQKYGRAMKRSRAVAETCRAVFPDICEGVSHPPEELGGDGLGPSILDDPNLPDDVREQVELGMDPAAQVEIRATKLHQAGKITDEQCTAAIEHARKGPSFLAAAVKRLDDLEGVEDAEVVDDGEVQVEGDNRHDPRGDEDAGPADDLAVDRRADAIAELCEGDVDAIAAVTAALNEGAVTLTERDGTPTLAAAVDGQFVPVTVDDVVAAQAGA